MEVIYLISVLVLMVSFVLIKKTQRKIDIISFIPISIVTFFCYNAFVCYILTFFTISITIWILALINILLSVFFIVIIIRKKEIQKYCFHKIDILYIMFALFIVVAISYLNFDFPFNINYETGDSATHFHAARMFAKADVLLIAEQDSDLVHGSSFTGMRTVSYVNSGLIMKCFCRNLDILQCYKVFVIFGILTLFLTAVTMYSALINFSKRKEHRLWAFIIALICMLGYPLNSFLFGFEYLSMGLLVICAIISFVYYYEKEILNMKYFIPIIALLNFGLFSSYYMFIPFMYPALWIYFCIKEYKRNKKIIAKRLIFILIFTLLIPFVLGYIYYFMPETYNFFRGNTEKDLPQISTSSFRGNGYAYINIYSNILLLLPLTIYMLIKDSKNNLFMGLTLSFVIMFIYMLLICNELGLVSMYYLSKNYYALWIILLYCNYKGLILISDKNKILPRIFICIYIILMIMCTILKKVEVEYYLGNPHENILSVMEIFGANKTILMDKPTEFNQEELEILKYAKDNLNYNSKIEVVEDEQPYYWSYVILDYINEEELTKNYKGQMKLNAKRLLIRNKINKVDYIIYFNKSNIYNEIKNKLFYNSEIIYENNAGGILRYNK